MHAHFSNNHYADWALGERRGKDCPIAHTSPEDRLRLATQPVLDPCRCRELLVLLAVSPVADSALRNACNRQRCRERRTSRSRFRHHGLLQNISVLVRHLWSRAWRQVVVPLG